MISVATELFRRFALTAILIGGGRVSYLVLFYVLAHVADVAQFGAFAVSLAICQVTWIVMSVGTGPAAQRIIPEALAHGNGSLVREFVKVAIVLSAVGSFFFSLALTIAGFLASSIEHSDGAQVAFASALLAPIITFSALREFLARSVERPILAFLPRDIIWCSILSFLIYFFPSLRSHVVLTAATCLALIETISWIVLFHRIGRLTKAGSASVRPIREWLNRCIALMMANVGALAFERVDVIAVGLFTDLATAGVYSVASRIAPLLSMAQRFIVPVISPTISRALATKEQVLLWREVRLGVIASVPLAAIGLVLIWVAAAPILALFGPRFIEGAWVLRILSIGHLCIALGANFGVVLLMGRRPWIHVSAVWLSLLPTSVTLYFAAKSFGPIGAATTISAGIVLYNFLVICAAVRVSPVKPDADKGQRQQ